MGIVIIAFIVVFIISKFVRMFFFNLHNIGIYTIVDFFRYVRDKEWTRFNNYGIDMFVGMFGHGKTLSMVHKARQLYKRYGNSIVFISNIHLYNIPYIPLVNFNQLVDIGVVDDPDHQGYVVLIDEISSVLSHRNFANFPLDLIGLLCRTHDITMFFSLLAQEPN